MTWLRLLQVLPYYQTKNMKVTTLLSSILGAVSAVTFSALPSFAQSTIVPITGGNFTATVTSGVAAFTSGTALTSVGTIVFSSVTGGTTNAPSGLAINNPVNLTGGSSNGTIGTSAQPFASAPLNLNGTITSIQATGPNIFNVGANVISGNITLPTSLVTPTPTPTPTQLHLSPLTIFLSL